MQPPVQEPARSTHYILFTRVLVKPLSNVAIPEEHHVHVVLVPTALGFYHFLHRRAAVHGAPFITAFPTQQHLHLPVRQPATLPALVKIRLLSSVLGPERKVVGLSKRVNSHGNFDRSLDLTIQSYQKYDRSLKKNKAVQW
jgi:hypothetical protein